jgi:hypothetical protein
VVVVTGHRASLRGTPARAGSLRAVTGVATPEWARHLPPGVDPDSIDLLTRASLPASPGGTRVPVCAPATGWS